VLASYADELERSKLPGYVSRYDDLDGDYETVVEGTAPASAGNPGDPPLRRGPLRSHTQHNRAGGSLLRGPHVSPRKDAPTEGIASETHRGESSDRFGGGL
jgi:stage V sporulation protein G